MSELSDYRRMVSDPLEQHLRERIAVLSSRLQAAEADRDRLYDAAWELVAALVEPQQNPDRVRAATDAARKVCLAEYERRRASEAVEQVRNRLAQGCGTDGAVSFAAANQKAEP